MQETCKLGPHVENKKGVQGESEQLRGSICCFFEKFFESWDFLLYDRVFIAKEERSLIHEPVVYTLKDGKVTPQV